MSKDITVEDVLNWKKELDKQSPPSRDLEVTEYNETHYRLSGCVWGIVPKKIWNSMLIESAEKFLAEGKGVEPLRKP